FALAALWRYKSTAGAEAATLARWPSASHVVPAPDRPTLVLFAHPKCPCTRASLAELRGVVSRFGPRIRTVVVFLHPKGAPRSWSQTDTWRDATSMEGVLVLEDED